MMKEKRIGLMYKRKKIIVDIEECAGFNRVKGLIFTNREKAKALLFNFNKPTRLTIHSIFVFFPFVAVWLDDKNRIIEKRIIKPFTLSVRPKIPFNKLVEIPLNKRYGSANKKLCSSSVMRKIYKDYQLLFDYGYEI